MDNVQMPANSQTVQTGDYLAWVQEYDSDNRLIGGYVAMPTEISITDDGTQFIKFTNNDGVDVVMQTSPAAPVFELYQKVTSGQ